MEVYIKGKRVTIDPNKSKGKGGEADVYDIGGGKVAKIFKTPDHPDYENEPNEQEGARERIAEHQKKLPLFPKNLPDQVISPEDLITDKGGSWIMGYTMPYVKNAVTLLKYSERNFRDAGVGNDKVLELFQNLRKTAEEVHKANVVIGDFNDLNILVVSHTEPFMIDADSYQFGKFLCRVFTARFVDPLRCEKNELILSKPHTVESDWYAYAVMLMQCLLFVDPYGGVYNPKNHSKRVLHDDRPLQRITIFNPEVKCPKFSVPYKVLPDDLLHYFHLVFEKDERGNFPPNLIEVIRWTKCDTCGTEHARAVCPNCMQIAPAAIKEIIIIKGKVVATRIFKTSGIILHAAHQDGKLLWLYHEDNKFRREEKNDILSGSLDPEMRFRIKGDQTLIGKNNEMITLQEGRQPERQVVDSLGMLPIFDVNEKCRYWTEAGRLLKDGHFGPEHIGNVLEGQTIFWVGPKFGFGFYRAGKLSVVFVFDAEAKGINDNVKLPNISGQIIDSTCFFTDTRCWFLIAIQQGGKIINKCYLIRRDGTIESKAEAEQGDGSWLSWLRGKCAAGSFLLAGTDAGIVRIENDRGQLVKTREFPDTEPFVSSGSHLFPGQNGVYVVERKEIMHLKIS